MQRRFEALNGGLLIGNILMVCVNVKPDFGLAGCDIYRATQAHELSGCETGAASFSGGFPL